MLRTLSNKNSTKTKELINHNSYEFKPMEITYKTGNKHLKKIESMNVIEYTEFRFKKYKWRPEYNHKLKELDIVDMRLSDSDMKLASMKEILDSSVSVAYISANAFSITSDNEHYQNVNNHHIEYSVEKPR